MRQLAKVTTGLFLIAALASCGGKGEPDNADGSESASEPSSNASSSDDNSPDSSGASDGKADSGTKTLTGTIADGVEPGCVVLKSGDVKYLLVGDEAMKLKAGMNVEVTGRVSDKTMSTCMEGTVFEVDTVEKIS